MIAGAVFLLKAGWSLYQYRRFQSQPPASHVATWVFSPAKNPAGLLNDHSIIGQLRVPRLQISAVMVEGDDDESLNLAAGHMTGTALVGSRGNAVVAGHRDTVFWPLRNIKAGDSIVASTDKKYVYAVEKIQVVDPQDTAALQDTGRATLTLVTCYPFRHVGPSPKRFVVIAKLLRAER